MTRRGVISALRGTTTPSSRRIWSAPACGPRRRPRRDARADAALLRGSLERRCLHLRLLRGAALADQLIDGGHPETTSPLAGRMQTERRGEHTTPSEPAG